MWNLGGRVFGFPLNPDQARLVLSLPVFAQSHDPGTAPGRAVAGPWSPTLYKPRSRAWDPHY